MSISRTSGQYDDEEVDFEISCDGIGCDSTHDMFGSFDDCRNWMRENGWRTVKQKDEWQNLCPGCAGKV